MKRRCSACDAVDYCKLTFGNYWMYKSGNGSGCNCPLERPARRGTRRTTPSHTTLKQPTLGGMES